MAKVNQSEVAQADELAPPQGEPVSNAQNTENERKNALESQEKAHAAALSNAHPALLPGKTELLNKGLLGEFEDALRKAESIGDQVKAAAINNLLCRIGDLANYVKSLEEQGHDDLKALCNRLGELFK